MKTKRFVSTLLALLLICGLPLSAFAEEYDLAQGSVTVNATESGQTVTHGSNAAVPDNAPVITQSTATTSNTITITAEENATANVTIQDVNIVISDPVDAPEDHSGQAAVTIDVADGASANVTLDGVNIDVSGTGKYGNTAYSGEAAVQITGNGDVTLELDGKNTLQGGNNRAAVEKNTTDDSGKGELTITDENEIHGSLEATGGIYGAGIGGGREGDGSNITITGSAEVTAKGGDGGAGIGGGDFGTGSHITISGSAEVTAQGGVRGAGIGGGVASTGSDITISGDAQVKAQGGEVLQVEDWYYSKGAAIGDGGAGQKNAFPDPGAEVDPDIRKLTPNGRIEYYAPGADMETDAPYKIVTGTYGLSQPAEPAQTAPLYRVIDQDGKALTCETERQDGVLTITVEADFAALTGKLGGIQTLKAQGIDTIVFVTNGASSTFALSDLLSQGSTGDSYTLTHDGSTVTFTLNNGGDVSAILQ